MPSAEQLNLLSDPPKRTEPPQPVPPTEPPSDAEPAQKTERHQATQSLADDWEPKGLAPMLQHYVSLKRTYPEHLLMFQVGDFYEIFFDDAPIASQALNIRLTSRNKEEPNPIPMCGVPIHALENYLPRLLQQGISCVIVSQVEESKNKKGMVQREITRIVTPGVRYEGDGLDEKQFNYLAAVSVGPRESGAVSFVDVSTGWLRVQEFEGGDELNEIIRRIRPAELLLPSTFSGVAVDRNQRWFREARKTAETLQTRVSLRPFERANRNAVDAELARRLTARDAERVPEETAPLSPEGLQSLSVILQYVDEVSFGSAPKLSRFSREEAAKTVLLDAATRRNLELLETRIDGEKKNSLFSHIDYTKTAMGSRLLSEWILSPSSDAEEIQSRHDAVEELLGNPEALEVLRQALLGVRDIDRLASRITGFRAVPRDLGTLRDSLAAFPQIAEVLTSLQTDPFRRLACDFDPLTDVCERLRSALVEDPPMRMNEAEIFRAGFHPEVDRLRSISAEGSSWLLDLETRERKRTGISNLKVKFNNVFGYFIEITKTHLEKVPSNYERRQTLVNVERFVLPELKEYEASLLSAKARQTELEKDLFVELRQWVCDQAGRIQQSARCLATIDALGSFAQLARLHNFRRPVMRQDNSTSIVGGRHPVVERVIGPHNFVPNDVRLNGDDRRLAVLTGPNMGGKSTYLRQVGLIQLLAQAGSFVPAEKAELGIVDRIFTRIGAADDLARGDSTFMVEMRETAAILRKATARSLVLIDEIGRGTATHDGLALATAIAEWLHDQTRCRSVFATHFHELTELAQTQEGTFCLSVGVIEQGSEISFTHRIQEQAADRSYGIEVARLAGLPEAVLARACSILSALEAASPFEATREARAPRPVPAELPKQIAHGKLMERLERLHVDRLTPLEALIELSTLQSLTKELS
ncbi:MAG: DNA mismatch repair protein MutS [Bdellovibrionota bacterium]